MTLSSVYFAQKENTHRAPLPLTALQILSCCEVDIPRTTKELRQMTGVEDIHPFLRRLVNESLLRRPAKDTYYKSPWKPGEHHGIN